MKYRVEQNGQFLGHWQAHTPKEAVMKAIKKYGPYYNINTSGSFDVIKGSKHFHVIGEE